MTDVMPAPGFYDDGQGVRRWWNGQTWTEHVDRPAHAPVLASDGRAEILNTEVARYVARGYAVEHADGRQAIVSRRIPMSFIANLLGVLLTGGLWLIYILVRIGSPQFERRTVSVTAEGVVTGALPATWRTGPGSPGASVAGLVISIVALLCSFSALGLVGALVALTCLLVGVLQKRTRLGLIGLVIAGVALIISIVALSIQAANGS